MKFKFTTKLADGSEVEVEAPEGWIPPEEIAKQYKPKQEVEGMVNRLVESRLAESLEAEKTKLLEDPAFTSKIFQKYGIPVDKEGKVKFPEGGITEADLSQRLAEHLAFHESQWKEKQLGPIQKSNETLQQELEEIRRTVLMSELAEGGRASSVADDKFKPFPGMGPHSAPVYNAAQLFAWDPKTKQHALIESKNGDGSYRFKINPNGTPDRPYYGPQEYYTQIAVNEKAFKDGGWFKDQRPSESTLGTPVLGGGTFDPATATDAELAKYVGA